MTRAFDAAVVAITLAWWSPTVALALIRTAPHLVAVRGRLYRIRRAHRLIDRGRVDEAERVIGALRREDAAADCWRARFRP